MVKKFSNFEKTCFFSSLRWDLLLSKKRGPTFYDTKNSQRPSQINQGEIIYSDNISKKVSKTKICLIDI